MKKFYSHKFIRTEDDRITLERIDGKECRIDVANAQTNDTGLWVFKIGTIENEIYKEVELKHIVKVDKSKLCIYDISYKFKGENRNRSRGLQKS